MAIPFLPVQAGLAAATAGIGIAQTIAANRAGKRAREENERQLEELMRRRKAGQLGLTGAERRRAEQQLLTPVQITAAEQQQRLEAQAAAAGSRSAGDIARARQRIQDTQALGAQAAASDILQQDIKARQLQEQEIEARLAAQKAQDLERVGRTFGTASQIAGTLGGLAGSVKLPVREADTGALASRLGDLGLSDDQISNIIDLEERSPGLLDRLLSQRLRAPGAQPLGAAQAGAQDAVAQVLANQALGL